MSSLCVFFFQAEDGIRDADVTGVQTCALPISVDARLGREQRRDGLTPGGDVRELVAHHRRQDAAPPVAGPDADERDTRRARDPAGNGELERVGSHGPDYRIVLNRGQAAVELENQALLLDRLGRRLGVIERLDGHLVEGLELTGRDRPQLVALRHAAYTYPIGRPAREPLSPRVYP